MFAVVLHAEGFRKVESFRSGARVGWFGRRDELRSGLVDEPLDGVTVCAKTQFPFEVDNGGDADRWYTDPLVGGNGSVSGETTAVCWLYRWLLSGVGFR